jgi:hypothetical protein
MSVCVRVCVCVWLGCITWHSQQNLASSHSIAVPGPDAIACEDLVLMCPFSSDSDVIQTEWHSLAQSACTPMVQYAAVLAIFSNDT